MRLPKLLSFILKYFIDCIQIIELTPHIILEGSKVEIKCTKPFSWVSFSKKNPSLLQEWTLLSSFSQHKGNPITLSFSFHFDHSTTLFLSVYAHNKELSLWVLQARKLLSIPTTSSHSLSIQLQLKATLLTLLRPTPTSKIAHLHDLKVVPLPHSFSLEIQISFSFFLT